MTRSRSDFDRAAALLASGASQAETARLTGIPRSTIRTWLARGAVGSSEVTCPLCGHINRVSTLPEYAYLLGLYLGDGCISLHARGAYKLRITLDRRYPGIIAECQGAMAVVLPNRVGLVPKLGCVEVCAYSKHWPCVFPQHGPGPKHKRAIILEPWQRQVVLVTILSSSSVDSSTRTVGEGRTSP